MAVADPGGMARAPPFAGKFWLIIYIKHDGAGLS